MDKLKATEGYTMIEMMIVLLVIAILMSISIIFIPKQASLRFFMSQLRDYYLMVQLEAIQDKASKDFTIDSDEIVLGERVIDIPNGIVCDAKTFTIYPSGNIHHAGTIRCYQDQYQAALTLQLGSGHAQLKE